VNAGAKLAGFGLVLAGALGLGALTGNVVGPISADEDRSGGDAMEMGEGGHETSGESGESGGTGASGASGEPGHDEVAVPAGVLIAQDGYALDAETTVFTAGDEAQLRFRIVGPDGLPVRDYAAEHGSELHLVVVGSDLGAYHHLHPHRDDDGTWSVALPGLAPGSYRAFADFAVAGGPELTLGVDLGVGGDTAIAPLPEPADTATVDGYEVTLSGTPAAGEASELGLTVRRDGRPVTDLDPYLGAFGHLVAIRGGDLAYLHVHPLGDEPSDGDRGGPEVPFAVEVPSPGDYRLFFDFSHEGTVHTAAFTVHVSHHADADADTGGHG
jgi:hypothetical protein